MIRTLFPLLFVPGLVMAQSLEFPGQPRSVDRLVEEGMFYQLPVGPWDQAVPTRRIAGTTAHQVYHLRRDVGAFRVLDGIEQQLIDQGFHVAFRCRDFDCGGFDFRFALNIIEPPAMFIDLGHFGFLSARHDDGRAIMLVTSRTQDAVHLHLTTVTPDGGTQTQVVGSTAPVENPAIVQNDTPVDMTDALETTGRFILSDLVFETGSSDLDGSDFPSLAALADYLSANPKRTIALVGHTDAVGSLDGNIALSKRRAGAVRAELLQTYGIAPERVAAEGMGYLAPVGPNTTEVGRSLNRRVEVIVTSTD